MGILYTSQPITEADWAVGTRVVLKVGRDRKIEVIAAGNRLLIKGDGQLAVIPVKTKADDAAILVGLYP